eukprot:Gb_30710 [translate_table: standard]
MISVPISRSRSQGQDTMKFLTLLALYIFLVCSHIHDVKCQSQSSSDDSKKNKFREREATDDNLPLPTLDEDGLLNTQCPQHVELRWQAEVSSSIYATPLIADINSDGKSEIVVPSFVHYLEVLEGSDGDKMAGWPAFHQSTVHASPLLYDIDKDGVREIALATYNGEVLFFRVSGYLMADKLEIPRLRARKDWYVGLKTDHADRSHPDVHDDSLIREATDQEVLSREHESGQKPKSSDSVSSHKEVEHKSLSNASDALLGAQVSQNVSSHSAAEHSAQTGGTGKLPEHTSSEQAYLTQANDTGKLPEHTSTERKNDTQANASKDDHIISNETSVHDGLNMEATSGHSTSTEKSKGSQRHLLVDSETESSKEGSEIEKAATVENEQDLEEDADSSFDLFRDREDGLTDEYSYDYDDYVDESAWGDEDWNESQHQKEEDYVNIDSHILCTPVIADIDKDGINEMIIAVSYFFDREYYENPAHSGELGGIDIGKYVAGAIVVFNLDTKQVKWSTQLDLSTDTGSYRAYIYSSPSVIDLDGDGYLDILVGTSFGYFYVLDHHGQVRKNFPLQMGEIQGQAVAADINDDGKIELLTTDTRGNVVAWTTRGEEIWERHVQSLIAQGPTVGDVDGDGHTEVVIPTISGNIYVLNGKDGSNVKPFPYRTHGRVMSPVLLVDLSKRGENRKGLTLATTSFDGYFYLIDGRTACADVIDVGETSYSMVLADNVDGGDDLDLIVTTMNGNVFCFSTPSPHHPLKSWTSQTHGRNNIASHYNREGIFVLPSSRTFRDEEGRSFWLQFKIVDQHRIPSGSQGPYNVTVTLLVPGNYQGPRRISQHQMYDRPDTYKMKLPTVPVRTTGTVIVEMVDKNGLYFSDEFSLTFHMHYYKLLKWLLVLPMVGMFGLLVILRPQEGAPLPSYSRNNHQL